GISGRRGIMAAHLEPAYGRGESLPVTERLTARSLILPLFHGITDDEQDQVVAVIRSAAEAVR
ncbi:MAG TPA: DegT/DnrJ/EryC1/StrS family aminotransferase, partial [Acidimicrobiales bacterium]